MLDTGVIVGTGQGGQREILKALDSLSIPAKSVSQQWPRDHYVRAGTGYVRRIEDSTEGNYFGDGGYVQAGNGYVIVGCGLSDIVAATRSYPPAIFISSQDIDARRAAHNALAQAALPFFPGNRIYTLPTGARKAIGHNHLDMSMLLLPASRMLLVDTYFGPYAVNAPEIDLLADKEKLDVKWYDGSRSGVWYPLNALVATRDRCDVVIGDKKAAGLAELLGRAGVEFRGVNLPQHDYPAGKIHCQTNVYSLGDDPISLLEEF
jgi:hypothetical protein